MKMSHVLSVLGLVLVAAPAAYADLGGKALSGKPAGTTNGTSDPAGIVGPAMSPSGPTAQINTKPSASNKSVPTNKVSTPPSLTYTADFERVRGTPSSRMGGWRCSSSRCTLKTTGTTTQGKLIEMCRGLRTVAKERGVKISVSHFKASDGSQLSSSGLSSCNR